MYQYMYVLYTEDDRYISTVGCAEIRCTHFIHLLI